MSWDDWLKLDPMSSARHLNIPTLTIHSDGAVLPHYTKKHFWMITAKDQKLH